MLPGTTTGRGIAAELGDISETNVKVRTSTVGTEEERDTGLENNRIRGQAERTDRGEEMGVI